MFKSHDFQNNLLKWYDTHARVLPWRARPGQDANPYYVWLSEIMLQQTTVPTVIPYFLKFIGLWPDIQALAEAPQEELLKEWAGLGYYARARNLHKCAQVIVKEYKSLFPSRVEKLLDLPGVGPYTAAAIAAIAFNRPSVVIDGNIERVTARIFAIQTPVKESKAKFREKAGLLYEGIERPGDFAQGLMDLGATICIPQKPRCGLCPVRSFCRAYELGIQEELPAKPVKKAKPQREGQVFWLENQFGQILLERRDEKRMLGGMMALPTTGWDGKASSYIDQMQEGQLKYVTDIYHSFTHFDLKLEIWSGVYNGKTDQDILVPKNDILSKGLPTVFMKAAKVMLSNEK